MNTGLHQALPPKLSWKGWGRLASINLRHENMGTRRPNRQKTELDIGLPKLIDAKKYILHSNGEGRSISAHSQPPQRVESFIGLGGWGSGSSHEGFCGILVRSEMVPRSNGMKGNCCRFGGSVANGGKGMNGERQVWHGRDDRDHLGDSIISGQRGFARHFTGSCIL